MQMYKTRILKLNERMLEGLKGFHKGLVEHGIILRSKIKNQTFQETIQKELDDMDRFQKEIHRVKDPEIRELTRALTEYACAFYKLVKKRGIENYKGTIEFLDKLYLKIDCKLNFKEDIEIKELIEDLGQICVLLDYKCQSIRKSGGTYYLNISPDSFTRVCNDLKLLGKLPISEKQERLELGMKIINNLPDFYKLNDQILFNLKEPMTTFELSKKLLVNGKTINERLNRLQRQNLVQRNVNRNLGKGGSFSWKTL